MTIGFSRADGLARLEARQWLPRPLEAVFPFFADAGNLEALTPSWLKFRILTPGPIEMRVGARIDYEIRWHGIPMRWGTEITAWEPPHRFVDTQIRGPYRTWIHEHAFSSRDGGTEVLDTVRYAVFGGGLVERLLVRRDVRRIFEFRRRALEERFSETTIS